MKKLIISFLLNCLLSNPFNTQAQIISTIAGGGNGDGDLATHCIINPTAAVVDSKGNIYIADAGYNRIRKVLASSGIITTIAGTGETGFSGDWGLATKATLNNPTALCADEKGNIYFSDQNNNRIRRINAGDGTIVTVAGNGEVGFSGDSSMAYNARLNNPISVKLDKAGNMYIVDKGNNRIRKVNLYTGVINTIVGNGEDGFNGDGGLAINSTLSSPSGMCIDNFGNIFIADAGNNRIRKVDHNSNIINTIAGNGIGGYSGDDGKATDANINLNSLTYESGGLSTDKKGNIYFADIGNTYLRKIEISSNIITTFKPCIISNDTNGLYPPCISSPVDIFIDDFDVMYIAIGNTEIIKVDNSVSKIISIVADNDNKYLGDNRLATDANLYGPKGLCLDSIGNIYFSDADNNRIRVINKSTGIIKTIAGNGINGFYGDKYDAKSAQISNPKGICIDKKGNVIFADADNHRIRKIDMRWGVINTIIGTGIAGNSGDNGLAINALIYNPRGICIDKSNNIYFSDAVTNTIRKVNDSTGIITSIAGSGISGFGGDDSLAINAKLNQPYGICLDPEENIYIADAMNRRIRKINTSTGIITTVAGNGNAGFSGDSISAQNASIDQPYYIYFDTSMNMYITEYVNNRIRYINKSNGLIYTIAGNGNWGFAGDGGNAYDASLNQPFGICLDKQNNIYFSDYHNSRIRKIEIKFPLAIESINPHNNSPTLFPNPSNGIINLDFNHPVQHISIHVSDMSGRILMYYENKNTSSIKLNIEELKEGIYFLNYTADDKNASYKVVKN